MLLQRANTARRSPVPSVDHARVELLSDAQWARIAELLPSRTGRRGRPFSDGRRVAEGIVYRFRCGLSWRDVPDAFGPWQTLWTWHQRLVKDGTWDVLLERIAEDDPPGRSILARDPELARAHRITETWTRGPGWVELRRGRSQAPDVQAHRMRAR